AKGAGTGWWANSSTWMAAQARIPTFQCPSDEPYGVTSGTCIFHVTYPLSAKSGTMMAYYLPVSAVDGQTLGRTNYVGVAGGLGNLGPGNAWNKWEGVFISQRGLRLQAITSQDGSANTLLFGETLGGCAGPVRDFSIAWMGAGAFPVAWNMQPTPADWYQYSSRHGGLVQFCFADASVRSIATNIDTTSFRAVAGWQDGVVANSDAIQ